MAEDQESWLEGSLKFEAISPPSALDFVRKPRPRILYLVSSWPHGPTFGGQLRALHVGRALAQVGEVHLAVVSSGELDEEARRKTAAEFVLETPVQAQFAPNRGLIQKLRWALDPRYLNVHGCAAIPADRERIRRSLKEYDLVWVLNSRTPNILQLWHWSHTHLDVDDVPSTYLRSASARETGNLARWKARGLQLTAKRRERLFLQRFTTVSVCSEEDREYLGGGGRIHVIPNGFERPKSDPTPNPTINSPRLGFIGLYSYAPNLDGVRWFLQHCWPAIQTAVPGIRFRLIGKDTDGPLRPPDSQVDALGWLADSKAEIATWSVMVIPIRFGGGTRIKIADAFSRKCPVVSTHLGAFGYEVQDGKQLRLADQPEDFAKACIDLVRNREGAAAMAERAWAEFLEKWTWDAIAPKVWAAAEDCLRRSSQPMSPLPA